MKFYIQSRKYMSPDVYRLQKDGSGRKVHMGSEILPGDRLFDTASEALAASKEGNIVVIEGEPCERLGEFFFLNEAADAPVVTIHVHRENSDRIFDFSEADVKAAIQSSTAGRTGVLWIDFYGHVFWRDWQDEPFAKTDPNIAVRYGSRSYEPGDAANPKLVGRITENLKKGWARHLHTHEVQVFAEDE